ncbi:Phosphomannomutase [Frankliniella fusca]|uniref:Phosphomannomutase n=1 Tax=Frankliniella fusca TaxID=407009 RepID=A0AAE1GZ05_9NEOP|nr:Phosphomannomutase [Frankliniella fusca]
MNISRTAVGIFRSCTRNRNIMTRTRDILCLFDVDGTLTAPRKVIDAEIYKFLMEEVKPKCCIGLVGGSDQSKIVEQMGGNHCLQEFDFVFSENGILAVKNGTEIGRQTIQSFVGEERLQKFINYTLLCLSEIELPVKRGTFVEFRTGMLNICPIGRSCSREERNAFEKYDKQHNIRQKLVEKLKSKFPDFGLTLSIGGQISIDVFPNGWDKTYSLNYLEKEGFKAIHFFGDKVDKGGNDHEIYNDARVIGHRVTSPQDTMEKVCEVLKTIT